MEKRSLDGGNSSSRIAKVEIIGVFEKLQILQTCVSAYHSLCLGKGCEMRMERKVVFIH